MLRNSLTEGFRGRKARGDWLLKKTANLTHETKSGCYIGTRTDKTPAKRKRKGTVLRRQKPPAWPSALPCGQTFVPVRLAGKPPAANQRCKEWRRRAMAGRGTGREGGGRAAVKIPAWGRAEATMAPFPTERDATLYALAVWPRGAMVLRLAPPGDVQRRRRAGDPCVATRCGWVDCRIETSRPASVPALPRHVQSPAGQP